jgi:hypothetical protein
MNRFNQALREVIILMIIFTLVAAAANAQTRQLTADEILYYKVQRVSDSIQALHSTKSHYSGYSISVAFPQYQIKSNISQLAGLPVSLAGGNVGVIFANQRGKIKANVGLYYSNDNVPYTMDLLAAAVTTNVYLLRLKNPQYHTIEPYAVFGLHQQVNRFFGSYLDGTARTNMSTGDQPLLGKTYDTQIVFGGGLEYQLENDHHQFIHFFTEFTYGSNVNTIADNENFSATECLNPLLITLGVHFGIVK